MPTYDYRCQECGYEFEEFQMMKDVPLSVCPRCEGELKRIIGGGIGVIFKGSGFYVTDNKAANSATTSTKSESSTAPSESSGTKASADKKSDAV